MNKKYIIRKNEEVEKIIANKQNKIVSNCFVVYYVNNNLKYNRYCISVSKKIGKANIRNLFKRRIKNILIKNIINYSKDYVIILRNAILDKKYLDIEKEILNILKGENK